MSRERSSSGFAANGVDAPATASRAGRERAALKEVIRLIDVGARGGIHQRWQPYHDRIVALAFEPDAQECASLNARRHPYAIQFLPVALGARDGEDATLFICRQPGCSSLLRPNAELCSRYPYGLAMEVVSEQRLTLRRMDTVCGDFQPDVLKVDTQGTELDILRGAGRLLDGVLAIEAEVEFVPLYMGQPLFADLDAFLRQQGFALRGLRRTYWRMKADHPRADGGQLVHGDALYLRPERMNSPQGHAILAAYRQYDLLAYFGATRLIPAQAWYTRAASRLAERWSNRALRGCVDRLRRADATDWQDPDFF